MLTQSKNDSREKKELKNKVMTMAAYIHSLMNLSALPIVQAPHAFDPNSAESQQLMKQMYRGKILDNVVRSWVDIIIKEGNKFISKFTSVYAKGETLLGEIQTLILVWETELGQCQVIIF